MRDAKRPVNRIASEVVTRRDVLGAATALAGGTALGSLAAISAAAASSDNLPPHIPDWQTKPGGEVMSPPYGAPSKFEASVVRRERSGGSPYPTKQAAVSLTPLQDLHGVITPNGLHYERHHAGVPTIDPQEHRLIVHGMVERPMIFTMDDILRFPSVSRIHFLECSGNTQNWGKPAPELTVQDTHGLLSCCEWTGTWLKTMLGEIGVKPEAKWMLAEGADAAAMTRSIPIEKVFDDAIAGLCAERRAAAPRAGLSLAPSLARLRRQCERQMAAPAKIRRRALADARGNVEIQLDHAGRDSPPIQFHYGGQVGDHVSFGRAQTGRPRLS